MTGFGYTLRTAREAKGYTIQQLAGMTNLMTRSISDLEQEDFSKIAAPIYGRGFVKLYCEAVGIDPKPLIDEFMAIYNGEKPPSPPPPATAPKPALAPEPAPAPEPAAAPAPEPKPVPPPAAAPVPTSKTCRPSLWPAA